MTTRISTPASPLPEPADHAAARAGARTGADEPDDDGPGDSAIRPTALGRAAGLALCALSAALMLWALSLLF